MPNYGIVVHQPQGLAKVLKDNSLKMPAHQREYSWEGKQIGRFYSDINFAMNSDGKKPYFFGCIVVIPKEASTQSHYMQVIDGQQRLATTTIFMAAARDYLKEIGESDTAASIENDYIFEYDYELDQKSPRLILNDMDNVFFKAFIIDGDKGRDAHKPSHKKIKESYTLARKKITSIVYGLPENMHRLSITRWVSFLANNAIVVMFQADDGADAFKMFETLNDRGLGTTQADLVKNCVFSVAAENIGQCQISWGNIKGTLETLDGKKDITMDFLRVALICMQGKGVIADRIYEITEKNVTGADKAFKFLSFLENCSKKYVAIFNPESSTWKGYPSSFKDSILVLNLLDIGALQPLVLSIALSMSKKETIKCYRFLVSLGVRMILALSTRSGGTYDLIDSVSKKVFDKEVRNLEELKESLAKVTASDQQFFESFSVYSTAKAKLSRYLLTTLERAKTKLPDPELIPNNDSQELTIEHILPQNPSTNWPEFNEAEVKMFKNRLGNKTLLAASDNGDLKNSNFSAKVKVYRDSVLILTSEISNIKKCNRSQLTQLCQIRQSPSSVFDILIIADRGVGLYPVS